MSFEEQREPGSQTSVDEPDDHALRCVECEHVIADRRQRTERGGAHEHTFVNPNGFVWTIGCFLSAPGVIHVGHTEQAFTWFPGFAWQIAVCGKCRAHVGWIFRCAPEQFHGLVLAALK